MDNTFCVYIHLVENSKRYIGITQNIETRWVRGFGYRSNSAFFADIQRVGWSNIEHIIVAKDLTKQQAVAKEAELIALYNTTDPAQGYNRDFSEHVKFINSPDQLKQRIANSKLTKCIEQLDPNTNEVIAVYQTISEAARTINCTHAAISTCLSGRSKTSSGYLWRLKNPTA